MAKHLEFSSVAEWVQAVAKGRPVAIMPASMAAEVLGLTENTIKTQLKSGTKPGMSIMIDGKAYVSVEYVQDQIEAWEADVAKIRSKLERIASRREKITYGDLMAAFDMSSRSARDRNKIGYVLGYISRQTWEEHGIFLSVIVHRKGPEPTTPGPGYEGLLVSMMDEYEGFYFDPDRDLSETVAEHLEKVWNFYAPK